MLLAGLVFMVLLPYLAQQRYRARRAQCELHQIRLAQAVLHFEFDNGHVPGYRNVQAISAGGEPVTTGWVYPILPYLTAVPAGIDYTRETLRYQKGLVPADSSTPRPYAETFERYGPQGPVNDRGKTPRVYIAELVCPANVPDQPNATLAWNSYVVNSGMQDAAAPGNFPADWPANGVFMDRTGTHGINADAGTIEFLTDGSDNTFLLTENVDCGGWTDSGEPKVGFVWVAEFVDGEPSRGNKLLGINQQTGKGDGSYRFARPSCYHSGGVNVAFCSGRTMFFNQRSDYLAFARMMMSDKANVRQPGSNQLIDPPYRYVPETR